MKKPQVAYVLTDETDKPAPLPSCPTCRSGIDPTITGLDFAAALNA